MWPHRCRYALPKPKDTTFPADFQNPAGCNFHVCGLGDGRCRGNGHFSSGFADRADIGCRTKRIKSCFLRREKAG